jgi:hypothetical protein
MSKPRPRRAMRRPPVVRVASTDYGLALRRRHKAVIALGVSIALALCSLGIHAAAGSTRSNLALSLKPDRSNAVRLDGSTVKGKIYVFIRNSNTLNKVEFYLDGPWRTTPPVRTEEMPPFDFAGTAADGTAVPYDTTKLANGSHTIRAVLTWSNGTTSSRRGNLTVANSGATATPTASLTTTTTAAPTPITTTTAAASATATTPPTTTAAPTPITTTTAAASTTATTPPTTTASATSGSPTTSTTAVQSLASQANPSNTGVPAGWAPTQTRTTDLRVTTTGAVVQDVRLVNSDLIIDASNVTVRRVEIQGGRIFNDPGTTCRNGLVIENVSIVRAPGQVTSDRDMPGIGTGGYTARHVKIDGLPEGFRAGGKGAAGCGPVVIEDSFAKVRSPDQCTDWHGDGLQGFDGPALTIRNVTLEMIESQGCGGTAPFFYPVGVGNTSVDIDGLLVKGGGASFREGMPGTVKGLKVVDGSWSYRPIDVRCSAVTSWQADIVTVTANYQPTAVRAQPCNTETGS